MAKQSKEDHHGLSRHGDAPLSTLCRNLNGYHIWEKLLKLIFKIIKVHIFFDLIFREIKMLISMQDYTKVAVAVASG